MELTTYNEIKVFAATLGRRRMEINDRELLDSCEVYLNALLAEVTPPAPPVGAPVCTTTPFVSGSGAMGETLSCTMGIWDFEPTDYAYRWRRNGSPIAVGDTYVPVDADRGSNLDCIVTATNAVGSADAPPSNTVSVAV